MSSRLKKIPPSLQIPGGCQLQHRAEPVIQHRSHGLTACSFVNDRHFFPLALIKNRLIKMFAIFSVLTCVLQVLFSCHFHSTCCSPILLSTRKTTDEQQSFIIIIIIIILNTVTLQMPKWQEFYISLCHFMLSLFQYMQF